jgi:hypothetical protein
VIPITESLSRDPDNDAPLLGVYEADSFARLRKEAVENTTKMPANCESLRLVVQSVRESPSVRSSYRLIGYSDEHTYQPVNFDSLDDLLKVLQEALTDVDVNRFWEAKQSGSSILFAEVLEISGAQRLKLGLRK